MSARFEIVRTDQGWHSRFRADNGKVVTSSEVYTRRWAALRSVAILASFFSPTGQIWVETHEPSVRYGSKDHSDYLTAHVIPIRDVDERVTS
jgi:uncharacterized protein YegP (UPF0339 family)